MGSYKISLFALALFSVGVILQMWNVEGEVVAVYLYSLNIPCDPLYVYREFQLACHAMLCSNSSR